MSTGIVMKTIEKPRLSVKVQTLAMFAAVAAAVAFPQLLHITGKMLGVGNSLGEMFLPMHLPILLVGLLAGSYAGAAAGLLAPIFSFALSGMPAMAVLPLMMVELFFYGLCTGLLRNVKMPVVLKVISGNC